MERWKPVLGYEGMYEVSDLGRVRRVGKDRMGRCRNTMLKFGDRAGYANVTLCVDAIPRTFATHRLVWAAFNGPIPETLQPNHLNGRKRDNRLVNLELVTPSGNRRHAIDVLKIRITNGGVTKGERNGRAKITVKDVAEIRRRYAVGGVSQQRLADEFGIDQTGVSRIILFKGWAG